MSSYSASSATRRGSIVPPLAGVDRPLIQSLPESCDILISGTGLVESMLASALAWQGSSVIHIDPNNYYGDASSVLGIEDLKAWVNHINSKSLILFARSKFLFLYFYSQKKSKKSNFNLPPFCFIATNGNYLL